MGRIGFFWALAFCLTGCSDGGGTSSVVGPTLTNRAPVITSAAAISISENALGSIYTLTATDFDGTVSGLSLSSGSDASLFTFNAVTGVLSLPSRLSFDAPSDAGANNVYDLTLRVQDNDGAAATLNLQITVLAASLKAALPPSGNFELIDWKLDLPVDSGGNLSGLSASISEADLAAGYTSEHFYTGPDGGMVLKSPVIGATTSGSTYARTELREMLRRGNTSISTRGAGDIPNGNNWALSSQPAGAQTDAGGVDGTLRVTMAVNNVTTTGVSSQIGRLIIGQIHAKDDEPIRLYYRKLPGNMRGSIYAEHEISGGADVRYEIIGDSSNSALDPIGGFRLDEKFTYEIIAIGNLLTVMIYNDASVLVGMRDIDISASGYDILNDFMYFKAGAYHVNNTADVSEFAQVTFYELTNTHYGYPF